MFEGNSHSKIFYTYCTYQRLDIINNAINPKTIPYEFKEKHFIFKLLSTVFD